MIAALNLDTETTTSLKKSFVGYAGVAISYELILWRRAYDNLDALRHLFTDNVLDAPFRNGRQPVDSDEWQQGDTAADDLLLNAGDHTFVSPQAPINRQGTRRVRRRLFYL